MILPAQNIFYLYFLFHAATHAKTYQTIDYAVQPTVARYIKPQAAQE